MGIDIGTATQNLVVAANIFQGVTDPIIGTPLPSAMIQDDTSFTMTGDIAVTGDATVTGSVTASSFPVASDSRLKDPSSVVPFVDGLQVARQLRPVRYRYNGRAGLPATEHIGVIAQEAQEAMPYAIERFRARLEPADQTPSELLAFNPHALQFVLVNAIKELDARLRQLEAAPDAAKPPTPPGGPDVTR